MKLKTVLLTGVMMMTFSVVSVYAQETLTEVPEEMEGSSDGLLASLFGEGGPLEDVLPEGTNIDEMIDTAKKQLGEADQEIGIVLGKIAEKAQGIGSSLGVDSLKEYAGELLGRFVGGDQDEYDLESGMEEYTKARDELKKYVLDHNAGLMDPADVQFVSDCTICADEFDLEETRSLMIMTQNNYTVNEENQLLFVSGARDIILFTQQNTGNGEYPVTDAVFAEDGEAYTESVKAMYEAFGKSFDDYAEDIAFGDLILITDLQGFLEKNPEYTGVEYDGEIRTKEELGVIWDELLTKMYGEDGEEGETGMFPVLEEDDLTWLSDETDGEMMSEE